MLTLKSIRHPKCELPSNTLAHKYLSQTKSPDKEPLMLEYCINTISHIQTQPTKTSFSASLLISLVFNCNLNNILGTIIYTMRDEFRMVHKIPPLFIGLQWRLFRREATGKYDGGSKKWQQRH